MLKMFKMQFVGTFFLMLGLLAQIKAVTSVEPTVVLAANLDVQPKLIAAEKPIYPASFEKERKAGSVAIELVVGPDGTVVLAKAIRSTEKEFEKPAIEAALRWKFEPGKKHGVATAAKIYQFIIFAPNGYAGPIDQSKPIHSKGGSVFEPAQLIRSVQPVYPSEMAGASLSGEVTVEFDIGVDGQVTDPLVVSSNNPWFERPALEAILNFQFKPSSIGGQNVVSHAEQQIVFNSGQGMWDISEKRDRKLPEGLRFDSPPVPVLTNFPVYPYQAYMERKAGKAVVSFSINRDGWVERTALLKADASEFGAAAVASLDAWRFAPAQKDREPVGTRATMTFEFHPTHDRTVPVSRGMKAVASELRTNNPKILQLSRLDATPRPLSRRPPVYPSALLSSGQPGEALIEFYIDENGDAQLPRIVSATAPEFGYAAVQAVAAWRFKPPMKWGKPVIARAQIPIKFETPAGPKQTNETTPQEKQP